METDFSKVVGTMITRCPQCCITNCSAPQSTCRTDVQHISNRWDRTAGFSLCMWCVTFSRKPAHGTAWLHQQTSLV